MPPDVLTGLPLDCCGVDDGDWTLLEPLLDLLLFDESELLDEPVPDEPVLVEACAAPGSVIAITPAAAILATPTVAVVMLSL